MASKPQVEQSGFEGEHVRAKESVEPTLPVEPPPDELRLSPADITQLRRFFEILDRWDREYREKCG